MLKRIFRFNIFKLIIRFVQKRTPGSGQEDPIQILPGVLVAGEHFGRIYAGLVEELAGVEYLLRGELPGSLGVENHGCGPRGRHYLDHGGQGRRDEQTEEVSAVHSKSASLRATSWRWASMSRTIAAW